jgi:hypothetical protein
MHMPIEITTTAYSKAAEAMLASRGITENTDPQELSRLKTELFDESSGLWQTYSQAILPHLRDAIGQPGVEFDDGQIFEAIKIVYGRLNFYHIWPTLRDRT